MDISNRQLEELRRLFLYRWFFSSSSYNRKYLPRAEEVEIIPNHGPLYKLIPLGENSIEYKTVKYLMGMDDIRILSISKIENQFLKRSYELKKDQKRTTGWINFELNLFHGTKKRSVKDICRENFNWRMHGKRSRNRCYYGKGVYFTPDATISRKYPRGTEGERYMLLSKVLIGNSAVGNPSVVIPPTDIDTTVSRNLKEIVKYEDNEFCPSYRIVFMIGNHRKDDIEIDGMENKVDTQSIPFRTLTSISQQLAFNFTKVHSSSTNDFGFNYPAEIEEDYYSDYSETSSDESSDDSEREIEGQARTTDEIYYVPSESWLASSIGGIFQILKSIWYVLVPQLLMQSSEESESDSSDSD
ncbi:uncharacterized protein LOC123672602 [Harmonia axyridis]|uniref:uncharacterized protein LOC123672602 n=1 Tax=Harmonia axyridis TaxID=115357 RepID=UPI001E278DC8|nr:uncharacterized protein LOC123672602 [Harmonia axyridis]